MKNMIVIPNESFSKEDMVAFVKSYGGYWGKEGLDQGVIDRNHFHIYVAYCDDINQEYDPDEIEAISKRLGRLPHIFIDIHIGWAEGSNWLASDFASQVLEKWGGFYDDGTEAVL